MADSFETFMKQRQAAALAYTKGDGDSVNALTSRHEPVTFFGPDGGSIKGSAATRKAFDAGASQFGPKGDSRLEILQTGSDGDVGYWIGIQHASIQMKGKDEPISMSLRITELFRREDGEWKLVHRHADMLKTGQG